MLPTFLFYNSTVRLIIYNEENFMLIIPNQKFSYDNQDFEAGRKYDVSETIALRVVENKLGKVIQGSAPQSEKTVRVRVPKVRNNDPVVEDE